MLKLKNKKQEDCVCFLIFFWMIAHNLIQSFQVLIEKRIIVQNV